MYFRMSTASVKLYSCVGDSPLQSLKNITDPMITQAKLKNENAYTNTKNATEQPLLLLPVIEFIH